MNNKMNSLPTIRFLRYFVTY